MDSHEIAKTIRSRFRTRMDGVISQNMRDKGSDYRINWGISLMHLRDLAADYQPNLHVALELWKDSVRESKIMALLLMPADDFTIDLATLWAETLQTQEIAEMAAMLLYQNLPYAPQFAYRLISQTDSLQQILGYNIISRIISQGSVPDARGLDELMDQIKLALKEDNLSVRHAAYNCFLKLDACDKLADSPYWHTLCQGIE